MVPSFWSKACDMTDIVAKERIPRDSEDENQRGTLIDLYEWINRCALDIIGTTRLGVDFDSLHKPDASLNHAYRTVFIREPLSRLFVLLAFVLPIPLLLLLPLKFNRDIRAASQVVHGAAQDCVVDKQRRLARREPVQRDMLTVALQSGRLSAEQVVDDAMTFLAAGHETTSTATMWACIKLARRPYMQDRLRGEVHEMLPSPNSRASVTADKLATLPYLHAFCNEILRFYPSVPSLRRQACRDLTVQGVPIPKGTFISAIPAASNHSPDM